MDTTCKSPTPEKNKCSPDSDGGERVAKSNARDVGCYGPDEDNIQRPIVRVCGPDEDGIRRHIVGCCGPDEDDIRSLPPVTDAASSDFIRHIWAAQISGAGYNGPGHVKDVLQVGGLYDVVGIKEAYTHHGPIQIWSFKCLKDAAIKKVFSCSELHRFTSDDYGRLDQVKRSKMIEHVRIMYKGYRKFQPDTSSKYDFKFLPK